MAAGMMIKIVGSLTGPKCITRYVYLQAPGLANANFSRLDLLTEGKPCSCSASSSQQNSALSKDTMAMAAKLQQGIGHALTLVTLFSLI